MWNRKAAEQGNAKAQAFLGTMYDEGVDVAQDYGEAVRWYRKAAEQGHASAQHSLGVMFDEGKGVPRDDARAFKWYRQAAEQGNARAQHNLGVMYLEGKGVPQDFVAAHMWFNLASAGATGEVRERAVSARDGVASRMTHAQVDAAQRQAREWKPTKPGAN
ncbi:MAG: sel1 repeat family protein [Gammaproteobacteria bacterium]|nr:sel1 repeat family protein [Gammaproteobacteria bacterium]